jgi:hypothetical protein
VTQFRQRQPRPEWRNAAQLPSGPPEGSSNNINKGSSARIAVYRLSVYCTTATKGPCAHQMNEELGYFEPRPWHRDRLQPSKVWTPDPNVANYWGSGAPEEMRK